MSREPNPISDALEQDDAALWSQCVSTLVCGLERHQPTRFRSERDRLQALHLAAAALEFARETHLAGEVRERLEDAV